MDDYKSLYYYLFNQITDIIESLEKIQKLAEEKFMSDANLNEDDNDKTKDI